MSEATKIGEHESVEWILKQIPKFSKKSFLKKVNVTVTSIDVNVDLIILGTNNGNIFIINRSNNAIENILLKKDVIISKLKLIHTLDLSIAIGLNDGSVYILTIPFNDSLNYSEMNQFSVPSEHKASISAMCWSKNSEKLYTGDSHGYIFCTELNHVAKTVSAYEVYQCFSPVNQLAYDHKCLIVSCNAETFMWNFNFNRKISIGNKNRNEQNIFGVSILNKLCKSEEMEVISIRPNGKIWISDINGIVKKSIILKPNSVFASDKLISLLPCVTSQSKPSFFDDVISGKTKFYLGLISIVNENEILLWSENSIILFDICSGNIISSSFNLGKIQNISICNILKMPITSNYKSVYEIWILRQPICENDSKLVRLSFIPLITTRLQIDPFYFCSQAKISANNESHQVISIIEENFVKSDNEKEKPEDKYEISPDSEKTLNWLSKIGVTKQRVDIVETFNDMRSNMLEFTNKTKEVFKQGQAILNNESELVVEQANELTEEGVVINFEHSNLSTENSSINLDPSLEVQSNIITTSCNRLRKENRKIEVVAFDESADLTGRKIKENSETYPDNKISSEIFEDQSFSPTKSNDSESGEDDSYERSELYLDIIRRPLHINSYSENNSFLSNDEEIVAGDEDLLNTKECFGSKDIPEIDEEHKKYNYNNCNISSPISTGETLDIISTRSTESYDALLSSNSFTDKDKFTKDLSNDSNSIMTNYPIESDGDHDLSYTIRNTLEEITDDSEIQGEDKLAEISKKDVQVSHADVEYKQIVLSNSILLKSNKWISHRGPVLPTNVKLCSMTVNKRMIWMTDTKSVLYVGFKNTDNDIDDEYDTTEKLVWLQDSNLRTDKLASSPNGFILWREKGGEISVYTGVTKILTPKVVRDKVLLKQYWEVTMQEIKEIDIDEEMAVIVTKKGQLKVINGISSRTPYKQSKSVNITGHVTLATTFNGLIWCVTELDVGNTSKLSQHVFACQAKDEYGNFNSTYWRTVPLLKDLVKKEEQCFGGLGGSELIKSIHLGTGNLAWILTIDNMCFYCQNVSSENPIGDGIWFQITLQFLYQTSSTFEDNMALLSSGIQNTVEKMFGYSEIDIKFKKTNPMNCTSSILISVKSVPKRARGNGLLWITSTERNSPCILFESDRNILGHHWIDCFSVHQNPKNRLPGLPAFTSWAAIEFSPKNTLWLLHKSGELFCYYDERIIRTVAIPTLYGRVVKISARNTILCIFTSRSKVLIRIGITENSPYGSDWREIKREWNKNEKIKNISCSDNEIWLIFENRVLYNENIKTLLFDVSKKLPWSELIFKNKDPNAKKVSAVQIFKSTNRNCIWVITEPFGYVYFSSWVPFVNSFSWTYIPGLLAESIRVSNENVWIVEQATGNLFVRCGIDWANQPMGDYWINVPLITKPVIAMTVSLNNQVFIVDSYYRLLKHSWTIIEGNISQLNCESTLPEFVKPDDYDWELLS